MSLYQILVASSVIVFVITDTVIDNTAGKSDSSNSVISFLIDTGNKQVNDR